MTPDIARIVVQSDPRGIASRLLAHLIQTHQASGGVLFAVQHGRVVLFATSDGMPVDDIKRAKAAWDSQTDPLAAGQAVRSGDACLMPILFEGSLLGGAWLDGVAARPCELGLLAPILAAAINAPPVVPAGHEDALTDLSTDEFGQRKLMMLLEDNEWNIARVARLMGTTRRTVYMRMERWGIDRQKVDKSRPRKLAPSES